MQHLFWQPLSILGISQLLLTRFWPNFKCMLLKISLTNINCHCDICQGSICLGNNCPYQDYFIYYWSNLDQTFWAQFFGCLSFLGPKFCLTTLFHPKLFWTHNFFGPKIYLDPKIFWTQIFFKPKIVFDPTFFLTQNFFLTQHFFDINFLYTNFFNQTFFGPKIFWNKIIFYT